MSEKAAKRARSRWRGWRCSLRTGDKAPTPQIGGCARRQSSLFESLREHASTVSADDHIQPIKDFQSLVEQDPTLLSQFALAFATANQFEEGKTVLGTPAVKTFDEFMSLLNAIMVTAPPYYLKAHDEDTIPQKHPSADEPAGVVAFPVNALLAWPMATTAGQGLFANALVNACFERILNHWSAFLTTTGSRYVLPATADPAPPRRPSNSVGWLHDGAKKEMVDVAFNFVGNNTDVTIAAGNRLVFKEKEGAVGARPTFEQVFHLPDPSDMKYYGFDCWDDFFVRKFADMGNTEGLGARPLNGLPGCQPWPLCGPDDDSVILNACESAPLTIQHNVSADGKFWLKGQEYSLNDMLHRDELASSFSQGCVYQAFLSALSYHNWNAPVAGTVVKVVKIPGTYFLENVHTGFAAHRDDKMPFSHGTPDDSAPNDSQKFLTAVATRMAIYIQAKNPKIGLMCFLACGMAEVSSCEALVKAGDVIKKGQPIGRFHYGGSTHCLIFRKETADKLTFFTEMKMPNGENFYNITEPSIDATNVPVLAQIAKCD